MDPETLRSKYEALAPLLTERTRRLDELRAVEVLEQMRCIQQAHCHELREDRKGQLSVTLEQPYRLIFEPANNPTPRKEDGGLDWAQVTAIRVFEVVDYHGR